MVAQGHLFFHIKSMMPLAYAPKPRFDKLPRRCTIRKFGASRSALRHVIIITYDYPAFPLILTIRTKTMWNNKATAASPRPKYNAALCLWTWSDSYLLISASTLPPKSEPEAIAVQIQRANKGSRNALLMSPYTVSGNDLSSREI